MGIPWSGQRYARFAMSWILLRIFKARQIQKIKLWHNPLNSELISEEVWLLNSLCIGKYFPFIQIARFLWEPIFISIYSLTGEKHILLLTVTKIIHLFSHIKRKSPWKNVPYSSYSVFVKLILPPFSEFLFSKEARLPSGHILRFGGHTFCHKVREQALCRLCYMQSSNKCFQMECEILSGAFSLTSGVLALANPNITAWWYNRNRKHICASKPKAYYDLRTVIWLFLKRWNFPFDQNDRKNVITSESQSVLFGKSQALTKE